MDMVGDAEDVELMLAIQVNQSGEREPPVAPSRMGVKLRKKKIRPLAHNPHFSQGAAKPRVETVNVHPHAGEHSIGEKESRR